MTGGNKRHLGELGGGRNNEIIYNYVRVDNKY